MMNRFLEKISFLWSGQALVGAVFLLAGLVIGWEGLWKLRDLWRQFAPHLPFSLPPDVAQRMQTALPLIFSVFVSTVGSICAVLMGISWGLSGIAEMFHSRKRVHDVPDFDRPELVAESLRSAQAQYWKSYSWILRIAGSLWTRTRFMSPISYNIVKSMVASSIKVVLLGIVIGLTAYGLSLIPMLLKKYAGLSVKIYIPSPAPLYLLLGLALFLNIVISLTMFPFRKKNFARTCEGLPVSGTGDPRMFFALLEEGAKLLSVKGSEDRRPVRLQDGQDPWLKGTLVESFPEAVRSFAGPAGFLCLPLTLLLLVMGFSRLIHFNRPVSPIPSAEFLTLYFPDYLMEVFFAIGLIITGLYFAEWSRKLFDVRRYRSALLFCHTRPVDSKESGSAEKPATRASKEVIWKRDGGTDERFAQWARQPEQSRGFLVEACWAEVLSESEGARGPRFLIQMSESESLDMALSRILTLPFCVGFQTRAPVCPVKPEKEPLSKK
jgi:hypothetical protein